MRWQFCVAAAAAASLAGCASIGPGSLATDRFDYSTAIAESWKEQTLLNIVKMRYMDLPVFVDVASVVAGYSLQQGVTVLGVGSSEGAVQGNYGSVSGQAIYTDRPTITYVPMTGEKFLRGLLTPIDPKNIFFLLQAGYAADFVLGLTVESLNGTRNSSAGRGVIRQADPEFLRVLELLRDVQQEGAFGMRIEEDKAKAATAVVFFRGEDAAPEVVAKIEEIRRLLKLAPDQRKLSLTYSPMRGGEDELAVNSRSMLQILGAFASYVEVPEAHVRDRSALTMSSDTGGENPARRARIRSGTEKPEHAYAAVHYRDHWYWVDDSDAMSKRALTATIFFFTLADTGSNDKLPLITIPAQ